MLSLKHAVNKTVDRLPPHNRLWLGFSGGLDSHVLLHCLRENPKLHVVHVNHGLQAKAEEWAHRCHEVCREYDVPCTIITVTVDEASGKGPEAAARQARYNAFRSLLKKGDVLLTAQHRDDQVETFLLQLLRGAGAKGLSAMAELREVDNGIFHCRPCLSLSRQALFAYGKAHGIQWIEDPSNAQTNIRRNFLRHRIIPALLEQWPGLATVIQRQVHLSQQTQTLLTDLAAMDYEQLTEGGQTKPLSCEGLARLSEPRRHNVLRYWIHLNGYPMPNERRLKAIHSVITAKQGAQAEVIWGEACVRRYKGNLHMLSIAPYAPPTEPVYWDPKTPYVVTLDSRIVCHQPQLFPDGLWVHYRKGGERFYTHKGVGSHPLKKHFQEWNVPPWERHHVPLISYKDAILAVVPFAQAHARIFQQVGIPLQEIPVPLFQLQKTDESPSRILSPGLLYAE